MLEGHPTRVTALPIHGNTDRSGAPKPDVAQAVSGDPALFRAELWFMSRGAYGVEVTIEGDQGGSVMVPVNSVAYSRAPMPTVLLSVVGLLCLVLSIGLVSILAAGFREASLIAGDSLSSVHQKRGWIGATIGLAAVIGGIYGGNLWRRSEDDNHRTRVLFRPFEHQIGQVSSNSISRLHLSLTDRRATDRNYALMSDHGKLIHLFLIGITSPPAFAHLHPVREKGTVYESVLPPLPPGEYRVFADLTHEVGVTQILTNQLKIVEPPRKTELSDPDDSWLAEATIGSELCQLGEGMTMTLKVAPSQTKAEGVSFQTSVRDAQGSSVAIEPYLRMLGHAVVVRADGGKFAHIHPSGTLSMAAARRFSVKVGGTGAAAASDAVCGDLSALTEGAAFALGKAGNVSFPFVFPTPGDYWLWVQVKVKGVVRTGFFKVVG